MLALWEFFWTGTDWVAGSPSPTPTPTPNPPPPAPGTPGLPSNAGGGGSKKRKRNYERVGEDFWIVRERYLRRVMPRIEAIARTHEIEEANLPVEENAGKVEAVPPGGILLQRQALMAAMKAAQAAQDAQGLIEAVARMQAIAIDISKIRQQYYTRAIALLLLDVF